MKIIIPMTGLGSRFINAGYSTIKPLIEVHQKPIISYVIDLFPNEEQFIFLCKESHLGTTPLRKTLESLKPTGEIISLKGEKLGPVCPVAQIAASLDDDEPVIISYCDFYMSWNYEDFKNQVQTSKCDGSIPCYTGFHPHLRHEKNVYAGCKVNNQNRLFEIREKHSFETDKTTGHHSAGIYYFKHARYIKHYFPLLMAKNQRVNNEFYVSMIYQLMLNDQKHINVYDQISHFCQWGTPEDLAEYLYYFESVKGYSS